MADALIYGKDDTECVVSVEIKDDEAVVFVQDKETGKVFEVSYQNKFWILANQPLEGFYKLQGDLHYKYIKMLDKQIDFFRQKRDYQQRYGTFHINNEKEAFMLMSGVTYYKGMQHKQVSVLSFDIETVGLELNDSSEVLIISNTYRDPFGNVERKLFCYDEYESPKAMLQAWCSWVKEKDPSILLGHNIYGYDLGYLDHCAALAGTTLDLGRNGKAIRFNNYPSKFRKDGSQSYEFSKAFIYGREIVDTMFLAIKYDVARNYESYGLKAIIKHEGLEVKDRQFYDAGQIRFKYKNPEEWEKIKKYALHDADDALALYDLMSASFFYLTQSVPKSYQEVNTSATGSQINSVMMRSYLQDGHSIPLASPPAEFEGAISFGNPGIYRNVLKVDVNSLYPSVMIQYEVFDSDKDPKGNFKTLVNTFTERRLEHKKLAKTNKYYDDLQNAEKIFINSCYGFLAAPGLSFNSPKNASFITRKGRDILNQAIDWTKDKGFVIANADTDSISVCKNGMSSISQEEQETYLSELNSTYPDKIKFAHDGYFQAFVVLKAKNYILFDGKKIKVKGSALRDQKKEQGLLAFLNDMIESIVYGKEDYTEIYHKYIREALNVQDIKRWSSKKTVTHAVLTNTRPNEVNIREALAGSDYKEADKVWLFFTSDDKLCLAENFTGDYSKEKLMLKLFKTAEVFENILPVKELFLNYSLKRNKKLLETL